MDPKLAFGLARQEFRNRGKAFDTYMAAHLGLLLPVAKLLRRPKMSRDEAATLFRKVSLSQRSTPGHILTFEFSDPDAKPVNGRFDRSVATLHSAPERRSIEGHDEEVIELLLLITRVSRTRVALVDKKVDFTIRHHAVSRYIERSGKSAADLYRDIAGGLLVNMSSSMSLDDPVRPLVVPTSDGAFLGLAFLHYRPSDRNTGHGIVMEHDDFRHVDGVPGASEWGTDFWCNTYIPESDMTPEQRSLLGALREADAQGQRYMMASLAVDYLGDFATECLPGGLPEEDTRDASVLDGWLKDLRDNPGWGRLMKTVRDGKFKELAERAIRFRDQILPVAMEEMERREEADRIASLIGLGGDRD